MASDLHAQIDAAVDKANVGQLSAAVREVLRLHQPVELPVRHGTAEPVCRWCLPANWPCPHVKAVASALGVSLEGDTDAG